MEGANTTMEVMNNPGQKPDISEQIHSGEPDLSRKETSDDAMEIRPERVVEAILLAADAPVSAAKIASILGIGTAKDVREHIEELNRQYDAWSLSFRIERIAAGYQLRTLPAFHNWLTKLQKVRQETKISAAAMETLAIVAYKQPCTRAEVESIRGVAAGDLLNRLREMNLVKIVGRADDLGRPMLYGTTKRFLETFGLPALSDLPQVEAFKQASAEADVSDGANADSTDETCSSEFESSSSRGDEKGALPESDVDDTNASDGPDLTIVSEEENDEA